jgi:CheY-like chemotaxis protein
LGIRVLLVEDVKASHEMIVELLDLVGGYRVVGSCATESAALQWLHEHPQGCDLVILDIMLREGSGFPVLAAQATRAAPDVVVFSDFASPAVADKCVALGAEAAIRKADSRRMRLFLEGYRGRLATSA